MIQAGIEILADQGVKGLSLRKVAKRAGVSHTAPCAHFTKKQALVVGISTAGFKKLYTQLTQIDEKFGYDPLKI